MLNGKHLSSRLQLSSRCLDREIRNKSFTPSCPTFWKLRFSKEKRKGSLVIIIGIYIALIPGCYNKWGDQIVYLHKLGNEVSAGINPSFVWIVALTLWLYWVDAKRVFQRQLLLDLWRLLVCKRKPSLN